MTSTSPNVSHTVRVLPSSWTVVNSSSNVDNEIWDSVFSPPFWNLESMILNFIELLVTKYIPFPKLRSLSHNLTISSFQFQLDQHGEIDQAIIVFEKVLAVRPNEPQSFRDLGLVCAKAEKYQRSAPFLMFVLFVLILISRALELLNEVVLGSWDSKFNEVELTALVEANRILAFAQFEGARFTNPIDPQLIHPFDLDVRISMAWDTGLCFE